VINISWKKLFYCTS